MTWKNIKKRRESVKKVLELSNKKLHRLMGIILKNFNKF